VVVVVTALLMALIASTAQAETITVTNTADGAGKCPSATECTLRAAVEFAKEGDTIALGSGTYTLAGKALDIGKNLTITGNGTGATTLTSSPASELIYLEEAELTISGITLEGGIAVAKKGTNEGEEPGYGGAIYNDYGILRVSACAFTNDVADASSYVTTYGSPGYGGAIYNDGKAVIVGSTFTNDTAEGSAVDSEYDRGGEGGAVYNDYGSLSVSSSTFSSDNAVGGADATAKYNDGGVGGAIYSEEGRISITGSTFSGNTAHGGGTAKSGTEGGEDGYGGALYLEEGAGTVSTSTFSGNTAGSGADAGPKYGEGGYGAGIYNDDGSLTLTGSVIKENTVASTHNGGRGAGLYSYGSVTIEGSTIASNKAPKGEGGGLLNDGGHMSVIQSNISGNEAADAGGIYSDGSTSVWQTTVSGNTASEGDGGGIYNDEPELELVQSTISGNSAKYGGGIYNDAPLGAANSTIAGNTATEEGGGIYNDAIGSLANVTLDGNVVDAASSGGNLYLEDYALTLHDSLIAAGVAPTADGNCAFSSGLVVSKGYNAEDSNQCQLDGPGDQVNVALDLGSLGSYGGLTQTVALLPGSAAIDKGDPAGCTGLEGEPLTVDQRGVARPQNGRCDVGAFEYVPPAPPAPPAKKTEPSAPRLSGLKISPSAFAPSSKTASIAKKHKAKKGKGATVSYTDSEAATTTFTIVELEKGLRSGKGLCKASKHSKKPKHGKACTKEVKLKGSFAHSDTSGHNQFVFTGHFDGHALTKGSYVLIATPRFDGLSGPRVSVAFKVL
jgi:CSLREA domain-containing protein